MSRGLGKLQLEILSRLDEIRRHRYPILWHQLHGDPEELWPDDEYQGHFGTGWGQPLGLYSTTADRALQVAYRRAANTLASKQLVEVAHRRVARSDILCVRLPVTAAEHAAVNELHREYEARKRHRRMLWQNILSGTFPPGLDANGARRKYNEHDEWIWKIDHIDRGPDAPQTFWLPSLRIEKKS